jgi:hypothetical protein
MHSACSNPHSRHHNPRDPLLQVVRPFARSLPACLVMCLLTVVFIERSEPHWQGPGGKSSEQPQVPSDLQHCRKYGTQVFVHEHAASPPLASIGPTLSPPAGGSIHELVDPLLVDRDQRRHRQRPHAREHDGVAVFLGEPVDPALVELLRDDGQLE